MRIIFLIITFFSLSLIALSDKSIDSIKKSYQNEKPLEKIKQLNQIAIHYHEISADSTVKYAELALKSQNISEYTDQKAIALNCLGLAFSIKGQYNKALDYYNQSKNITENNNFQEQLAFTYIGLGDIHKNFNADYDLALKEYLSALNIYESINNPIEKINVYEKIANLYIDLKEPRKALEFFTDALEIAKKQDDEEKFILTNHRMGQLTIMSGDPEEGVQYCLNSLQISEDKGYKLSEAKIRSDLGFMFLLQGDIKKAQEFHTLALEIHTEFGNLNGAMINYEGLAQSYFLDQQPDSAIKIAKESIAFAENAGLPKVNYLNIYQILSRAHEAKDEYEEALRYMKVYFSLKDEIFNTEKSRQISELQVAHDTEKKEREIQEFMIKEQKNAIIFIAIVSTLVLILAIVFFLLYRNRRKAAYELGIAKEQAEKANKLKTAILTNMTHEIKTPLNFINSSSMLLKMELNSHQSEDTKEALEGLHDGVLRLNRTVDLFMTLATVKSGNYIVNKREMNIDYTIQEIYNDYKYNLDENKDLNLIYENNLDSCSIVNDEPAMNVILKNILDNAVKFTDKGKVEIKIYKNDNNKCSISVEDTGIGIKKEFLGKIFEPFTQEEMDINRSYDGNGLGLALAKEFAIIIDAEIEVESKKGKGSKFIITLN